MAVDKDKQENGYDAFISYSHEDEKFASKLQKALSRYHPPKDLDVPQRRLKIFRDKENLTGTAYEAAIEICLGKCKKLIVVCSPNSRKSFYVNDEITRWVKQNNPSTIIPILLSGLPNNKASADQDELKAFPKALYEGLYERRNETPLASSFVGFGSKRSKINKGKFEEEWHKLLSNIYGVALEKVAQLDRRAQLKKRNIWLIGVSALALVLAGLAGYAFLQKNLAEENAREATWQALVAKHNERKSKRNANRAKQQEEIANEQRSEAVRAAEAERTSREQADEQRRIAQDQEQRARRNEIASSATLNAQSGDPVLGVLILNELVDKPEPTSGVSTAGTLSIHPLPTAVFVHRQAKTNQPLKVNHVAISRSGRFVATALDDGTVWLWNSDGIGNPTVLRGHKQAVKSVAFSPAQDDQENWRLVSASYDGTLRIWRGKEPNSPLILLQINPPVDFGFSPMGIAQFTSDGSLVVAASRDSFFEMPQGKGFFKIWMVKTGVLIKTVEGQDLGLRGGDDERVANVAFSPQDLNLLSLANSGKGDIWAKGEKGFEVHQRIATNLEEWNAGIGFSRDGSHLAVLSQGRDDYLDIIRWKVRVYWLPGLLKMRSAGDASKSDPLVFHREYDNKIVSVALNSTGSQLVIAFANGIAEVWQLGDFQKLIWELKHDSLLTSAVFNTDGTKVLTSSEDGTARVWTLDTSRTALTFPGTAFTSVGISPDSRYIVAGDENGVVRIGEITKIGELVLQSQQGMKHKKSVGAIMFVKTGKHFFTATSDGEVLKWSVKDGKAIKIIDVVDHNPRVKDVWFDSQGSFVAFETSKSDIDVWRLSTPPNIVARCKGNSQNILKVSFGRNGREFVSISTKDHFARVWRLGPSCSSVALGAGVLHTESMVDASFDSSGKFVVTASNDGQVVKWPIDDRQKKKVVLKNKGVVRRAILSPGGSVVLTVSQDRIARIWPGFNDDEPYRISHESVQGIKDALFSRDGNRIMTFSQDKTARVWEFSRHGHPEELLRLNHENQVKQAIFSLDGNWAVTRTAEGSVKVWPTGWKPLVRSLRKQTTACLTPEQRIRYLNEERVAADKNFAMCEKNYRRLRENSRTS